MCVTKVIRGVWLTSLVAACGCLTVTTLADTTLADTTLADTTLADTTLDDTTLANKEQTIEQRVEVTVDADADDTEGEQLHRLDFTLEEVKPGKYWIGVLCSPLENELLQAHLDVEQGLVVTQVVADSPAQKAGLQKDDILIKVGDQSLADLKVLVTSTEKAKDSELTLTIVRKGKRQTVNVTPAKRPSKYAINQSSTDVEAVTEWRLLQETLRKHGAAPKSGEEDTPDRTSMMFVMPGFVWPDQAKGLPKNLEVTVTKKGQQEARITVKQGDKKWDVDSKTLDKLPEDIRPHIEKMLGQGKEMRIRMGSDGIGVFGTPKNLFAPRIIRESLQIAPNKVYELHQLAPKLNRELREKIHVQLEDAHRTLEEAKTKIPADALERIEVELKTLREQLKRLRAERDEEEEEDEEE